MRDANGKRRMVYLGAYGSAQGARRYREVPAEQLVGETEKREPSRCSGPDPA